MTNSAWKDNEAIRLVGHIVELDYDVCEKKCSHVGHKDFLSDKGCFFHVVQVMGKGVLLRSIYNDTIVFSCDSYLVTMTGKNGKEFFKGKEDKEEEVREVKEVKTTIKKDTNKKKQNQKKKTHK